MASTTPPEIAAHVESLIPKFQLTRLLNQDQAGRRISLLGTIDSQPAILLAERAAFATDSAHLSSFSISLANIKNLGANDIYSWFLACSAFEKKDGEGQPPDLKLNLIYPCTEQHVKKYSAQGVRVVTETPDMYSAHIRPFIAAKREKGTLNWVYNIIEGRTEQEDVIYRENSPEDGFLLLPDLNWDRKTVGSLHLLGIVERRDIWSVRDLRKSHIVWLKHMREKMMEATVKLYPELESDMLKLYVHYQPTYYHFHIHIVSASLDAGPTQSAGKALILENIISTLEVMPLGVENEEVQEKLVDPGMGDVTLSYHLGEQSELWQTVFLPMKEGKLGPPGIGDR
ncbi:scavenger mRNA decapping enzyme [Amniculicola lignicola CBS 123094]|uniref:Scavenger mRNA decapping enzyme n=1 Tax=Amniculicola lignicola CBS 123094 TaxID=1392246 RepID=A0A6A5VXJ6_9PLEO|nr:scavenger mRNA decapping enzyme [Amniculicola lignicola CBS 123094]